MIAVPLTFIPILIGIIPFLIWANTIQPSLPIWGQALVVGGIALFIILSFLAFHRVRLERDNLSNKVIELESQQQEDKKGQQTKERIKSDLCLLIFDGKEVQKGFQSALNSNQRQKVYWPVDEFKKWQEEGFEVLQEHKLHDDNAFWFKDVSIDISGAVLEDFIEAVKAGLNRLEKIIVEMR